MSHVGGLRVFLSSWKCELNPWALSAGKTLARGFGRAGGLHTDMHTEAHQGRSSGGTAHRASALRPWQFAPLKTLGHTAGLQLMG